MPDLLLELRSEDVPAEAQARAGEDLGRLLAEALAEAGFAASKPCSCWSTPRRLVVRAQGIPASREARREERRGPRTDAPAKAVEGFLRSTGLSRDALEARETPKGEFLFAVVEHPATPAAEILSTLVPAVVRRIPWRKSMRWGSGEFRWVRPLHGIVCLLDSEVVDFEVGGIRSGRTTRGHRFLAPDEIEIASAGDYEKDLHEAYVTVDPEVRHERMSDAGERAAQKAGFCFVSEGSLLKEVTGLVEWPVVFMGTFDESFLALPQEVLATTMRHHQRYFPLTRKDGSLVAAFLVVADIEASDGGKAVRRGNERVLHARLADAAFFWERDRARPLADRIPGLGEIVFHAKLGSMKDKARRISELAAGLAPFIPDLDSGRAKEAGLFAKADLTSDLVNELPELQGIVGGLLAQAEGLGEDVSQAIYGHLRLHSNPAGFTEVFPRKPLEIAVALADRLDTLVGFFAAGDRPTGSGDPFALRQAARGVIEIVSVNRDNVSLPLREAFGLAHSLYPKDAGLASAEETTEALMGFFLDRLPVLRSQRDVRRDLFAAVLSTGKDDDLVRLFDKARKLGEFLKSKRGVDLLAAYRRATRILTIEEKRDGGPVAGDPDPEAVVEADERGLLAALDSAGLEVEAALARENDDGYAGAMEALAALRDPVDAFFEKVTVNADDASLRANRLRLLFRLRTVFDQVADLSLVEGAEAVRDG